MSEAVVIMLPAKYRELADLKATVDAENPDPQAVVKWQKMLDDMPEIWAILGDVNAAVQARLIERLQRSNSGRLSTKKGLEVLRQGLGYETASQLEKLLIDLVVTCWLRWQDIEWRYSSVLSEPVPVERANYWEQRLSATQRRYLRACETLARVRKIASRTPALQVNIAADGGQQVNVVGDLSSANSKLASQS